MTIFLIIAYNQDITNKHFQHAKNHADPQNGF